MISWGYRIIFYTFVYICGLTILNLNLSFGYSNNLASYRMICNNGGIINCVTNSLAPDFSLCNLLDVVSDGSYSIGICELGQESSSSSCLFNLLGDSSIEFVLYPSFIITSYIPNTLDQGTTATTTQSSFDLPNGSTIDIGLNSGLKCTIYMRGPY